MYDNRLGRDTVANTYIVRQTLVCLLLATFLLQLFFSAPLDRVYIMLLELQLMVNFAIFHVTLPGNVVIASTILKPLVSYNFLKILDEQGLHSLFGKDDAVLATEEGLDFLGQRATFGYDTTNVMFNLRTIATLLALYLLKIVVVIVLWCLTKLIKDEKKNGWIISQYEALKDQILFSDLMFMSTRCFFEVGIATFISFESPYLNIDLTMSNAALAISIFLLFFLAAPLVYFWIIREVGSSRLVKESRIHYQRRFASSFLGVKISHQKEEGFNRIIFYIGQFYLVRILLLVIAFSFYHQAF